MIGQARHKRMPVVQVEVDRLAQPADRANDLAHVTHGGAHGVLDVRDQARQPGVRHAEMTEAHVGMTFREPGAGLPDADVPDVDADAHVRRVPEMLRDGGETAQFQAGRVLNEQRDAGRLLAEEDVQFAHGRQPVLGQFSHVAAVVDDQAGDPPGETAGEVPDHLPALVLQQADAAVHVHDGQPRFGGGEPQHVLELIRRVRVHLGGHAHLGEPEPGQPQQRVIPGHALLEQGVHGPDRRALIGQLQAPSDGQPRPDPTMLNGPGLLPHGARLEVGVAAFLHRQQARRGQLPGGDPDQVAEILESLHAGCDHDEQISVRAGRGRERVRKPPAPRRRRLRRRGGGAPRPAAAPSH